MQFNQRIKGDQTESESITSPTTVDLASSTRTDSQTETGAQKTYKLCAMKDKCVETDGQLKPTEIFAEEENEDEDNGAAGRAGRGGYAIFASFVVGVLTLS